MSPRCATPRRRRLACTPPPRGGRRGAGTSSRTRCLRSARRGLGVPRCRPRRGDGREARRRQAPARPNDRRTGTRLAAIPPCTQAEEQSDHRRRPTSDPSLSNVRREYVHVITIGGQVVKARIAVLVGTLVATASVAVGATAAPSKPEAQSATIVGVAAGDKRFST